MEITGAQIKVLKNKAFQNRQTCQEGFKRLQENLKHELSEIKSKGNGIIPDIDFESLKFDQDGPRLPEDVIEQVRKRGCLIIRNVVPNAEKIYQDLREYLENNGLDPDDPEQNWFQIYWSKPQFEARMHPNMVNVYHCLNRLWQKNPDLDSRCDVSKPLFYIDKFRIRNPGDEKLRLKPHVDSGYVGKFDDWIARRVTFSKIFSGHWEEYDPFVINGRGISNYIGGCKFFRSFQGWTALTSSGPGQGTLRVLPLVKEATAYILLRGCMDDVPDDEFPGSEVDSYAISETFCSEILEAMVSIPKVNPGDTVWWHPDLIHSVESKNDSSLTNSVLYIPAGFECPINRSFVERLQWHFSQGIAPEDFKREPVKEMNFKDRATWLDLNEDGKRMMGC